MNELQKKLLEYYSRPVEERHPEHFIEMDEEEEEEEEEDVNDTQKIRKGVIIGLIQALEAVAPAIDWDRVGKPGERDDLDMALQEAREAVGLDNGCDDGQCSL